MYKVIALAGKAGSGKDTILHEVIAAAPDRFHEIISCTTRPPREGEIDGVNYHFLTLDEFYDLAGHGQMLEYTLFNEWRYGTPTSSLVEDKVNIGVFNPAGLRSLSASPQVKLFVIFIYANGKVRLLRQLNREKDPNVDEIIRRYGADEKDFLGLSMEFPTASWLCNEEPEDLDRCVNYIVGETDGSEGQKRLRYTL